MLTCWTYEHVLEWNTFMWVTYCTHFIAKLRPKEKLSVDDQCGPSTRSVFLLAVCNLRMTESCRSPAGPAPLRACAVLAPGMSLPRKLGGSSPGKEELNTCRIPATAKWKGESSSAVGLYAFNCPLVLWLPLLPHTWTRIVRILERR